MTDTEKRMDSIVSAQNGIKQTELKLEQINREIDDKYKTLRTITQQNISKDGKVSKDTPLTPNLRETIRSLKRDGWTISELASRFNRTETEIELLLEVSD